MIFLVAYLLAAQAVGDSLADRIKARVSEEVGAQVGVGYVDLSSDTLFLNADTRFHAASTMKVPVMITRSSNPATNTLIELVGGAAVTRRMRQLGRGIPDGAKANRLIADVSRLVYQHHSALHSSP